MTTPKKMTPERLRAMLRSTGNLAPNGAALLAAHIAALEQEVAAARAEGFAAAREMAVRLADRADFADRAAWSIADDIRAMQDGQRREGGGLCHCVESRTTDDCGACHGDGLAQDGGQCPKCGHEAHDGLACGVNLTCLCGSPVGQRP